MNKILDIDFQIDPIHNGLLNGKISITANENIIISQIIGKIVLSFRGKFRSKKIIIDQFYFLESQFAPEIQKQYDFPFQSANRLIHETYLGINTSFSYEYEVEIIQSEDYILSEFWPMADKGKITRFIFSYINSQGNYHIEDDLEKMKVEHPFLLILAILSPLAISSYFFIPFEEKTYLAIGIILVSIFIALLFAKMLLNFVGNIECQLKKIDNKSFSCELTNQKNWRNIFNSKVQYRVIEEVIDNRGTSEYTHIKTIYSSETKDFPMTKSRENTEFKFPEEKNINSFNFENIKIRWDLDLMITTYLGIKLFYRKEFHVKKVTEPNIG